MKSLKNYCILLISLVFTSLLISCSSGSCASNNNEFLFTGYNFANNLTLSGVNNYTTIAGQESSGQFVLNGNSNFAIRLYSDNPSIQIIQSQQLSSVSSPSGIFTPATLQISPVAQESTTTLFIQSTSNLALGNYKLNLYADPINNSLIKNHTYLGYIWIHIIRPSTSTIFITNRGGIGVSSGVIGCNISPINGMLSNCDNFTTESYFNSNLLAPNGIATVANKLFLVDNMGGAPYPVWQCNIESAGKSLAGCKGYTAESLGLNANQLKFPQGLTINSNQLYITAESSTLNTAYIYTCNLDSNNNLTSCTSNNITTLGTINAAPIAASDTNIFTLYHPTESTYNTGTITCNLGINNCNIESSPNTYIPLTSLTGINTYNNNVILTGDTLNSTRSYTGALLCNIALNTCTTTGPNLASFSLPTAQFGINNSMIFIPLKDLNISNPASKIEICPIDANGSISTQCQLQDSSSITGLSIPNAVAFYNLL